MLKAGDHLAAVGTEIDEVAFDSGVTHGAEGIARMIQFYNEIRPHMSIGMLAPMEVYRGAEPGKNLWKKEKYADN